MTWLWWLVAAGMFIAAVPFAVLGVITALVCIMEEREKKLEERRAKHGKQTN